MIRTRGARAFELVLDKFDRQLRSTEKAIQSLALAIMRMRR